MNIYAQIDQNKRRTFIIVLAFITVITLLGWVFGEVNGNGLFGIGLALIIAGVISFSSYYYSDQIVLSLSHAREIKVSDLPELFHLVENLCIATGMPMPRLYVIEDTAPNAFATGRDPQHAVICVTTGILSKLDKRELEAVLAHELSHIKNYDIRLMSIVVILVGVIALLSDWFLRSLVWGGRRKGRSDNMGSFGLILFVIGIVLSLLAPLIASLMKLALSREREYLADASAVYITRYPAALASALEKINHDKEPLEAANKATAHLYIINPLKNYHGKIDHLFSTHPPIEDRIQRLRAMQ